MFVLWCGSVLNVVWSFIVLFCDVCGRGDCVWVVLCVVIMFRVMMGTLSGVGAREAETRDWVWGVVGVLDKWFWIDCEVLYCVLEMLISEEVMVGLSEYRVAASTRMDEARVRERVKTLSVVGSVWSDVDMMECVVRFLVDDDDIEGVIVVFWEWWKKLLKNFVRDDTKFSLAKTTALLRYLCWVWRMCVIRFLGLLDDGDRVLLFVWWLGSKYYKFVDDVEVVKLGGEVKAAL